MVRLSGIQNIQPVFNTKSQFTNPVKAQVLRQDSYMKHVSFQGLFSNTTTDDLVQQAFNEKSEEKLIKAAERPDFNPNIRISGVKNKLGKTIEAPTALLACVSLDWNKAAGVIMKKPKVDINAGINDLNPLIQTILRQNTEILEELVNHTDEYGKFDLDVNVRGFKGYTPVMMAYLIGYEDGIRILSKHRDVSFDVVSDNGLSAKKLKEDWERAFPFGLENAHSWKELKDHETEMKVRELINKQMLEDKLNRLNTP